MLEDKEALETRYVFANKLISLLFIIAILGNHTFAAIRGKESYELLSIAFSNLIQDINSVINKGQMKIGDTNYQLKFLLGGDYKVLHLMHNVLTALDHLLNDYKLQYMLIILGLNAANSNYACIWCHIPKEKRYYRNMFSN